MECIKEKRFLFWKYKSIKHTYKTHRVSKSMDSSITFLVEYKCEVCGDEYINNSVEKDELLLAGIPVCELKKVTACYWYCCA
jgi:hypothetical protein